MTENRDGFSNSNKLEYFHSDHSKYGPSQAWIYESLIHSRWAELDSAFEKKKPRSELKLRSCIPRRALSYTNSDGILSLSIFFYKKDSECTIPRGYQEMGKCTFQSYWEKIMATTYLVCCVHQIPFYRHPFCEFSAVNFDINPVESDLAVFLHEKKSPRSLIFSTHPRPCMM